MSGSFLVLFVTVLGLTSAQDFSWGGCPKVPVKRNFDITKFTGTWHEFKRIPVWFESNARCNHANITIAPEETIEFSYGGIEMGSSRPIMSVGSVNIPDSREPAKLQVRFSRWSTDDYWVMATDYRSFAIMYSCSDYLVAKSEKAWIMTRQRGEMNPKNIKRIYKILKTYGINTDELIDTEISEC